MALDKVQVFLAETPIYAGVAVVMMLNQLSVYFLARCSL